MFYLNKTNNLPDPKMNLLMYYFKHIIILNVT